MPRASRWPVRAAKRLARSPLLHFLIAGGCLFALYTRWAAVTAAPARGTIVVSAADVARLRREWAMREGAGSQAPPADAVLIDEAVDHEVLLREALAREYDRRDPIVRKRLLALGHYLGLAQGGDDAAVEREARALGLTRSDEVVQRHLAEMMRLAAAKPGPGDLPSEAALRTYYEQHATRFAEPLRVRLTHVYLSRDRRGDALDADATALLTDLQQRATDPRDAGALGDPFVRSADVGPSSAADLDRVFGPGFAAALADLPEHTWSGPIASPYGLHLVWIEERLPPATLPFAAVETRALHQYLDDRSDERLRDHLRTWRARYDVRIEP
jgi:hypothetical protein